MRSIEISHGFPGFISLESFDNYFFDISIITMRFKEMGSIGPIYSFAGKHLNDPRKLHASQKEMLSSEGSMSFGDVL